MGSSCMSVSPSMRGLSGLYLRIFLSLPEHFQVVSVLLLQIEFFFIFRQAEQLLSAEKRVIPFLQFFISLLSALLVRVHVGNHLRIHVAAYHMPKHRVLGISQCADASSVPHHIVNLLSTSKAK